MKLSNIAKILSIGAVALVMAGCGGGSSSPESGESIPSGDTQPLAYSTLSDLEFKTLNITAQVSYGDHFRTLILGNNYIYSDYIEPDTLTLEEEKDANGYPLPGCSISKETKFRYICLRIFRAGHMSIFGINISADGHITGNYEYSTGNIDDIMNGLLNDPDASIVGYVSTSLD